MPQYVDGLQGLRTRQQGPVDASGLTKVATDDAGLMDQPSQPQFKVGLVECYNKNHPIGGSDKLTNKHRFDSIPIANGVIKTGLSCQIIEYHHEEHDKFMEVVKQFDAIIVRCNPGHIDADGGLQQKFDKDMQALAKNKPVWPTADVMNKMGAKDALVKIKDMDFGLVDTLGYYSPEDMKAGFPKTIAFQPRVVKQNRGSAGEGIWIIKLKEGNYCANFEDRVAAGSEVLILKEANDNHIEEHTVDEFIEFCSNGRNDKSGTWTSQGAGKYFAGGAEAGGQMVDQRFIPTIDEKGEARFFMCGMDLYNIEHYLYIGGVSGETKTTVYSADAPEYAVTRKKLEEGTRDYMEALGLDMSQLPLLWAADFLFLDDGSHKIGEFNCSCLGVTGFLDARGKDISACKPEDIERGQAMCDHIGQVAFKALKRRCDLKDHGTVVINTETKEVAVGAPDGSGQTAHKELCGMAKWDPASKALISAVFQKGVFDGMSGQDKAVRDEMRNRGATSKEDSTRWENRGDVPRHAVDVALQLAAEGGSIGAYRVTNYFKGGQGAVSNATVVINTATEEVAVFDIQNAGKDGSDTTAHKQLSEMAKWDPASADLIGGAIQKGVFHAKSGSLQGRRNADWRRGLKNDQQAELRNQGNAMPKPKPEMSEQEKAIAAAMAMVGGESGYRQAEEVEHVFDASGEGKTKDDMNRFAQAGDVSQAAVDVALQLAKEGGGVREYIA